MLLRRRVGRHNIFRVRRQFHSEVDQCQRFGHRGGVEHRVGQNCRLHYDLLIFEVEAYGTKTGSMNATVW